MSARRGRRGVAALAAAGFLLGARAARAGEVRPIEIRCFQCLNRLPHQAFVPVWVVMQLGSLAGSVGVGLGIAAAGRRRLGVTLAVTAAGTWAAAKLVKPGIQRGRPTTLVASARVMGREQSGLGYPSGHAAVAMAVAAVAAPHVAGPERSLLWATAAGVGAARVYVGAHLPLDIAGGMALGLAIGTLAAPSAAGPPLSRRRAGFAGRREAPA
jgi:undecaprenyl-diphosphatase